MRIEGKCHCGNISFGLRWPGERAQIPVRVCGCTFCIKHAGAWTSHRDSELIVEIRDGTLLSKYRFGTSTADFYICARCGVVPFVTSAIDAHLYAVVNVNTFEGIEPSELVRTTANFDGEGTGDRLLRRKQNWIGAVRISTSSD
jgi:hypothetical protein